MKIAHIESFFAKMKPLVRFKAAAAIDRFVITPYWPSQGLVIGYRMLLLAICFPLSYVHPLLGLFAFFGGNAIQILFIGTSRQIVGEVKAALVALTSSHEPKA
jgi:hypothetical protein